MNLHYFVPRSCRGGHVAVRRLVFSGLAVLMMTSLPSFASGTKAGVASSGHVDEAFRKASEILAEGCRNSPGKAVCAELPFAFSRLLDSGEFHALSEFCKAFDRRTPLPEDALALCGEADARLGNVRESAAYLERWVSAAGDGALSFQRSLLAASILERNARYPGAFPFLKKALHFAYSFVPDEAGNVRRKILSNRLDSGLFNEAASAAAEIVSSDKSGDGATFVIGQFLAQDRPAMCVPAADELAGSGSFSVEKLAVAVSCYSKAGLPDKALSAAAVCLDRCDNAQGAVSFLSIAGILSRAGMAREAATFAAERLNKAPGGASELFEVGRLQMSAGMADQAWGSFREWISSGRDADSSSARLEKVAAWLLESSHPEMVIRLVDGLKESGARPSSDVTALMIRALCQKKEFAQAEKAALDAVAAEPPDSGLRIRLASLLYEFRRAEAAAAVLGPFDPGCGSGCSAGGWVHVLRARLVSAGVISGNVESELLAAVEASAGDQGVAAEVRRLAASTGTDGLKLKTALAESAAAADPDNPELLVKLAKAYMASDRGMDAADALALAVRSSRDRDSTLVEGVDLLLSERYYNETLWLLKRWSGGRGIPPAVAVRIGDACLEVGERSCVTPYFEMFLGGPVSDDFDYVGLSERLAESGFRGLALKALDVAARASSPEGAWRRMMMRGRLALIRGDSAAAAKAYSAAARESPARARVLLAIGADYAMAGNLQDALFWVGTGVNDPQEQIRLQTYPTWVDLMRRLGRVAEISLKPIESVRIQNLMEVKDAIDILADAGRPDLAVTLLDKVRPAIPPKEKGELFQRKLDLQCALKDRRGAAGTAEAICGWSAASDGTACAEAGNKLIDAGFRAEGMALLKKIGTGSGGHFMPEPAIAYILRRLDAVDSSGAADVVAPARAAAAKTSDPASFVRRLWGQFPVVVGKAPWFEILDTLESRADVAANVGVMAEIGLARIASGDTARGFDAVRKYASAAPSNVVTAFNLLVSGGSFDLASRLLNEASPVSFADVKARDLSAMLSAYRERGLSEAGQALLRKYLIGNGESASATVEAARALAAMGEIDRPLRMMKSVSESGFSPDSRFDFGTLLFRSGDRKAAMAQFKAADGKQSGPARGSGGNNMAAAVLGFLDSEGAVAEMAEFMNVLADDHALTGRLMYSRARTEASLPAEDHLKTARKIVFDSLKGARHLTLRVLGGDHDDILDYVRTEARRGTAAELAEQALSIRGAAAAELGLFSACLAGRDDLVSQAMSRLGLSTASGVLNGSADLAPASSDMLAAARLLHQCGRWDMSADLAMAVLKTPGNTVDALGSAVTIAVESSVAHGRPVPVSSAFLDSITQDRMVSAGLAAMSAMSSGDRKGDWAARDAGRRQVFQNSSVMVEALDALASTDQEAPLAEYAMKLAADSAFPGRENDRLHTTIAQALRFDQADKFTLALSAAGFDDTGNRLNRFKALVDKGDTAGAISLSEQVTKPLVDPSRTLAAMIGYASAALRGEIVRGLLAVVESGLKESFSDRLEPDMLPAVTGAAFMLLQDGLGNDGFERTLKLIGTWSRDKDLFCSTAVTAVFSQGGGIFVAEARDRRAYDGVERLFTAGICNSPELLEKLREFKAASSTGPRGLRFAEDRSGVRSEDETAILCSVSAKAALIQGRYDDAAAWYRMLASIPGSQSRLYSAASELSTYLGDQTPVPPDERKKLAEMALEWLKPQAGVVSDGRLAPIQVQMIEMARGIQDAIAFMDREIAVEPASSASRNNVAYVASIRGTERRRFAREIEIAEAFSGQLRGSYMDTRAWGLHVYGDKASALNIQTQASLMWRSGGRSGLSECYNHFGMMLESAGRRDEAVEMYRRATMYGDSWDWHSILSSTRLRSMGYFKKGE